MVIKQTTLDAWLEWRELCSLAHEECSEATRRTLSEWGSPQVANRLRKRHPSHELLKPLEFPSGPGNLWRDDLWHLLETQMHATSGETGKRWKDWLFEKAEHDTGCSVVTALEKMTSAVIRTAVDRFAAAETTDSRVSVASLDAPASGDSESRTLAEELLEEELDRSSPDNLVAEHELEEIAEAEARLFLTNLTPHERRALAVREAGLKVKDPQAQQFVGRGKSQLSAAQVDPLRAFCEHLQEKWTSESRLDLRDMAGHAVAQLKRMCLASLTPEERRDLGL